ncbi:hypothetical protein ACHAP7_005291 [Fusarium lateritium]
MTGAKLESQDNCILRATGSTSSKVSKPAQPVFTSASPRDRTQVGIGKAFLYGAASDTIETDSPLASGTRRALRVRCAGLDIAANCTLHTCAFAEPQAAQRIGGEAAINAVAASILIVPWGFTNAVVALLSTDRAIPIESTPRVNSSHSRGSGWRGRCSVFSVLGSCGGQQSGGVNGRGVRCQDVLREGSRLRRGSRKIGSGGDRGGCAIN